MKNILKIPFFFLPVTLLSGCYVVDAEAEVAAHRTKNRIDMACDSIEMHQEDHGSLPEVKNGLEALIERASSFSKDPVFVDGWKQPLRPVVSGASIVGAYSVGPNGKDEQLGGDDISCRVSDKR